MPITVKTSADPSVLHDKDGNPIDSVLASGVRRLEVNIGATEIEIGHVVLKNDATEDHATCADDGQAIDAGHPTEGVAVLGTDGTGFFIPRTNGSGNLVTVGGGGVAPLNTVTFSAPTFATVGVASALAVAANAARKGLVLVITTAGRRVSFGFGANAAVLDSGITILMGQPLVLDAALVSTQAVNAISNIAGTNLSIQEAT